MLAAFAVATVNLGCVDINGGAVELSWALRTFDGERISLCGNARVDTIRLNWKALADADSIDAGASSSADGSRLFACADSRGITPFEVSTGQQLLWIEPVCDDGTDPGTGSYQVPAPIVRTVTAGTVVTLDALLIVADECLTCPGASDNCGS